MAKNSLFSGNFGAPIGAVDGAGIGAFAAIRCISEAELSNFNRLVLIFCVPRAHARAKPHPNGADLSARRRIGSVDGRAEASLDPAHPGKGRMT